MSERPRRIFSSVKFKWGLFWQVGEIFVHLNELHSELRIWQECPGSLQGLSGQRGHCCGAGTARQDWEVGFISVRTMIVVAWQTTPGRQEGRAHLIDFCNWDQFNIVSCVKPIIHTIATSLVEFLIMIISTTASVSVKLRSKHWFHNKNFHWRNLNNWQTKTAHCVSPKNCQIFKCLSWNEPDVVSTN